MGKYAEQGAAFQNGCATPAQSMDILSLLQWPAMAASLAAAWLVASQSKARRKWGFWWFLASNAIWGVWGVHDKAWALIGLQLCLAAINIRGARKNETAA